MLVGLDVVAHGRLDGVDVGVDQHQGGGRARLRLVDQLAQRGRQPRDQREFIGGPEALQVVGPHVEHLRRRRRHAVGAHLGAGGVELVELVLQPLGELPGQALEGRFGTRHRVGVKAEPSASELGLQGVWRLDHPSLIGIAHGGVSSKLDATRIASSESLRSAV